MSKKKLFLPVLALAAISFMGSATESYETLNNEMLACKCQEKPKNEDKLACKCKHKQKEEEVSISESLFT